MKTTKQNTIAVKQARAIKQNIADNYDPESFLDDDDIEAQNMEYLSRFAYAKTVMYNDDPVYYV